VITSDVSDLTNKFMYSLTSFVITLSSHVNVGPCHQDVTDRLIADRGDGLQIWWVAAEILNKQSRTAVKGWSSRLGTDRETYSSSPWKKKKKNSWLRNVTLDLGLGTSGGLLWTR